MNALEMPDQLERSESAENHRRECLSLLKSLQNTDGGWGFHAGGQSRVEPSCWAALSLFHYAKQQNEDSFRKLVEFLRFKQLADGSWPASPEMKAGRWVTSLACSLLYDRMCPGGGWNCGNPRVYGVDGDALVLATCWALLALHDAPEQPGRALSLAWLETEFAKIESAGSLAMARMTLEKYGM